MTNPQTSDFEDVANLRLDLKNPRLPDEAFDSEEDMLNHLIDRADVEELVQSILSSGWLDYEPLIILANEKVVLEGNRRLAALKLIADQSLRERLRFTLPAERHAGAEPTKVRVHRVQKRSDARGFIGFKHINGPFKWDSLAKAKFAAEWVQDGDDIRSVSRQLGDSHNTVVRLVNGWNVLQQAMKLGFDRNQIHGRRTFPFSHLYTALARPNVRRFLGLPDDDLSQVLARDPIPTESTDNLQKLMSWLYGQKDEPSVIPSQNPYLNYLVEVLGNDNARAMLEASRDLDAAYDQVEDKNLKFSQALMLSIRQSEDALRLVGNFDGRADLMSAGDNLMRTVRSLHRAMKAATEGELAGDGTDGT